MPDELARVRRGSCVHVEMESGLNMNVVRIRRTPTNRKENCQTHLAAVPAADPHIPHRAFGQGFTKNSGRNREHMQREGAR